MIRTLRQPWLLYAAAVGAIPVAARTRRSMMPETDLADLPPVQCNIGDINQVLLNLIVNAAQATADARIDQAVGVGA
jgi:signal transduction histidine kinase